MRECALGLLSRSIRSRVDRDERGVGQHGWLLAAEGGEVHQLGLLLKVVLLRGRLRVVLRVTSRGGRSDPATSRRTADLLLRGCGQHAGALRKLQHVLCSATKG